MKLKELLRLVQNFEYIKIVDSDYKKIYFGTYISGCYNVGDAKTIKPYLNCYVDTIVPCIKNNRAYLHISINTDKLD